MQQQEQPARWERGLLRAAVRCARSQRCRYVPAAPPVLHLDEATTADEYKSKQCASEVTQDIDGMAGPIRLL